MINYIRILKPDNSATPEEIKQRYLQLVKQNHPDLFPEEKRREQNLVLMEINEAYLILHQKKYEIPEKPEASAGDNRLYPAAHKDPAYVYYKSATDHLNQGNYIFNWSRYTPKNKKYHFDVRKASLLRTASEALEHYTLAYKAFMKVCSSYPNSIWTADSLEKLNLIEKLNERYSEIIERLT
jgi:outer membrane protein assembly factor BamD (BamD/ComL family)